MITVKPEDMALLREIVFLVIISISMRWTFLLMLSDNLSSYLNTLSDCASLVCNCPDGFFDANFVASVVSLNIGTISKIAISGSSLDKYV